MHPAIRTTTTWFLAALLLLLTPVTGRQQVLCLGADGHFAVEGPAESALCHSDHETTQPGFRAQAASDGCLDIPLTSEVTAWRTFQWVAPLWVAVPGLLVVDFPIGTPCFSNRVLAIDARAAPPPSLGSLTSTVLII
jgi:hypothetical protein